MLLPKVSKEISILFSFTLLCITTICLFIVFRTPIYLFLISTSEQGAIGYILIFTLYVILSFPFVISYAPLTLVVGYLYGTYEGTVLVSGSALVGSIASFLFCRFLLRHWLEETIEEKLGHESYNKFGSFMNKVESSGLHITILLRFTPIPFGFANALFALSSISLSNYTLGTFIGLLPMQIALTYFGSTVRSLTDLANGNIEFGLSQQVMLVVQLFAIVGSAMYITMLARQWMNDQTKENNIAPDHCNTNNCNNKALEVLEQLSEDGAIMIESTDIMKGLYYWLAVIFIFQIWKLFIRDQDNYNNLFALCNLLNNRSLLQFNLVSSLINIYALSINNLLDMIIQLNKMQQAQQQQQQQFNAMPTYYVMQPQQYATPQPQQYYYATPEVHINPFDSNSENQQPFADMQQPLQKTTSTPKPFVNYAKQGTTIKMLKGIVTQKREVEVPVVSTGLPTHLPVDSLAAELSMDILALSKETSFMNDDCLRGGIWAFVVQSLMQTGECETSSLVQILQYLMAKNAKLMMRGLDFFLYLFGHYRCWEEGSSKLSYKWTKPQKKRVWPNLTSTFFDIDRIESLLLKAGEFMKEQAMIQCRVKALSIAFKKIYKSAVPNYSPANKKLIRKYITNSIHYWELKQKERIQSDKAAKRMPKIFFRRKVLTDSGNTSNSKTTTKKNDSSCNKEHVNRTQKKFSDSIGVSNQSEASRGDVIEPCTFPDQQQQFVKPVENTQVC